MRIFYISVFLLGIAGFGCGQSTLNVDFGFDYSIQETAGLPVVKNDSLFVQVAYSGCNGGHEFRMESFTREELEAVIWLFKVTPDQQCEAFFSEEKSFLIPSEIRSFDEIVLLAPDGERFELRQ